MYLAKRSGASCLLLAGTWWLVVAFAGGQDFPATDKQKKEKGPKGDKGDPEAKAVMKTAEKASRPAETEREKWNKELGKTYPDRVSPGVTREDFDQWFDLLSGRGAEWRRGTAPRKQIEELFDRAALRLRIGDGAPITRDAFIGYARDFLLPGGSPPWKEKDPLEEADKLFEKLDRDRSGFLETEEWTDRLRNSIRGVDANGDGRISPAEYRLYFEGRVVIVLETGRDEPVPPNQLEPRPAPHRYRHTPSELPAWFSSLDADRDSQVTLYEWRQGGGSIEEFRTMDLNGDGLLPPDEYLRYAREMAIQEKQKTRELAAQAE